MVGHKYSHKSLENSRSSVCVPCVVMYRAYSKKNPPYKANGSLTDWQPYDYNHDSFLEFLCNYGQCIKKRV